LKGISSILPSNDIQNIDRYTITHLWSGLKPALLLCTNPSIHFTVFDTVKDVVLKYKSNHHFKQGNNRNILNQNHLHHLTMMEAFVIGLLAKFVATMLTYPLIRVKVLLMVTRKRQTIRQDDIGSRDGDDDEYNRNSTSQDNKDSKPQKDSMISILMDIYERDGMMGLYKGCSLQLLHTLLKSALSMMIRERVTNVTQRLIHLKNL
jgi:hypothetical protein